ncbi:glycosyltransferase [Acidovorax sp. sic0104]|uniref:glycosyltransferase n=1 Tax=Acidovorax sp. sic0104 TaxID=2854784 RepID=UPI001C48A62C|nr:glycosyltransferase [Acidovorax sp. sic0104]MBV7540380.1 glycosyltransferase [Acidovorax sp. sic0104]
MTSTTSTDTHNLQAAAAYEGFIDTVGPSTITGWALDACAPARRLVVEVLCDGAPVAQARADQFRADLAQAGKSDGGCAFSLPVPLALLDGRVHEVAVRIHGGGPVLPAKISTFSAEPLMAEGAVQLDGGALVGAVRFAGSPSGEDATLWVRDVATQTVVAQGQGQADAGDAALLRFRIALPAPLFDGRPHAFTVHRARDGALVQCAAVVMPHVATPEHALLANVRHTDAPRLAALAGYRYDALARQVARIGRDPQGARALAQLGAVHARVCKGPDAAENNYAGLEFPTHPQPRVSVVIPACNQFHLTYHCLAALLLAPHATPFEVIVVDDGSSDRTQDIAQLVSGITCIRHETPQGFVHACNRGAMQARGEYVVLLNNDTEVTPDWLDELLWPFENFERVGLTGAQLLFPDGRLQEAGGIVWSSANPANYGRGGNPYEPRYSYARQADYLSGACLMVPAALWRSLGGLDAAYAPAYFEDTDLAFRVRERGYRTVYAPLSRVVHFEGGSNGTDLSLGVKQYQEVNRPRFRHKWIEACAGHGREGMDIDWVKDRGVPLRALVIDVQTPTPDRDAGSYAAIQEMRLLQALGFKCTFVPQDLQWAGRYTQDLQRMGVECLHAPYVSSIAQMLGERGGEFDLVYITRYHVAQAQLACVREFAPRAKVVLMNADLHFLRELRGALAAGDAKALESAKLTRSEELAVMSDVDLVLTYTAVEEAVIQSHNLDVTVVGRCPWVSPVADAVAPFAGRAGIAFLGGFGHPPNQEAVEWFLQNVWASLRAELPDVQLHIYGSNAPPGLAALVARHEGVILQGWVPRVATAYAAHRVFIAPLQSGAGIKGKVIGALAHGVPSVLSPLAAEGISVADGIDALLAGTPTQWVEAVSRIYRDDAAWRAMSARAQVFVRARHGFAQGVQQMQDALQRAGIFSHPTDTVLVARDPLV